MPENERVEFTKREKQLERAWRHVLGRISKTVLLPLQSPSYLKQPPVLIFEQTRTFELRRQLSHTRGAGEKNKIVLRKKSLRHIEPKRNLTQNLRLKWLKRQPIFSECFEKYYKKYQKPPFKLYV